MKSFRILLILCLLVPVLAPLTSCSSLPGGGISLEVDPEAGFCAVQHKDGNMYSVCWNPKTGAATLKAVRGGKTVGLTYNKATRTFTGTWNGVAVSYTREGGLVFGDGTPVDVQK